MDAAGAAARERPSASLDIKKFRHGTDEFDEWSDTLESAVTLATNATGDNHSTLCKKWLPLKLDSPSRAIYKQANKEAAWTDLKTELTGLLIDPQEKYKWQAKRSTPKWDGKESFHALASRIITKVALYDGEMTDALKQKEYFFRFREALPKEYQNAIDMACGANDRNLETAKDIAQRTKMICDSDDKSVTFAGARLDENRTSSLKMALAKIDSKLETMDSSLNTRLKTQDDRISKLENSMEEMRSAWRSQSYQSRSPRSQSPRNASSNSMPRGFSPRGQSFRPQSPRGQFLRPQSPRNQQPTSQQYDSRGQSSSQGNYRSQSSNNYYPQSSNQGNYCPQSPNQGNYRSQSSNQGNYRPQSPRGQNYNSGNSNYNTPNSPRRSNSTYVKQPSNSQGNQRDNYRAIDTDDERDQTEDGEEEQLYAALSTIMKRLKLPGQSQQGEN